MMVSGKISLPKNMVYSDEMSSFTGNQSELMQSGEVAQRATQQVLAADPNIKRGNVSLTVGTVPRTTIFTLIAKGNEAIFTQKYLDAVLTEYIAKKRELREVKSDDAVSALSNELIRLEKEIKGDEDELTNYQKSHNISILQNLGNSASARLTEFNAKLVQLKSQLSLYEKLDLDAIIPMAMQVRVGQAVKKEDKDETNKEEEAPLKTSSNPFVFTGNSATAYQGAKLQLQNLKNERDDYARTYKPKHPDMVELERQIESQERLVESYRKAGVEELQKKRDELRLEVENTEKSIKEYEPKALDANQQIAEFKRIQDKIDRANAVRIELISSRRAVDVSKSVDAEMIDILERASPSVPQRPDMPKNLLLGCLAGLLGGFAILLILDQFDDRVVSTVEFISNFPEASLVQIPRVRSDAEGEVPVIQENDTRHQFLEALRAMRSSLLFLPTEGAPPKSFLVTSAVPNEGKSTVAANLAITMAFANSRVLLVDSDLRRGALHRRFHLKNEAGFSDALQNSDLPWRSLVQVTKMPGLSLLSRGSSISHPGEHLLKKSTEVMLQEMMAEYDYVIIDSPPVMVADDTTSLAPKIDATIFIVRFGFSATRVSRRAIDLLKDRQANVIGIACNDVEESSQEYTYYRYPEYYGTGASAKS